MALRKRRRIPAVDQATRGRAIRRNVGYFEIRSQSLPKYPVGKADAEKIITRNGKSYVALIDAQQLDYYHRLERERIHLVLLDEVEAGLADVESGRVIPIPLQ